MDFGSNGGFSVWRLFLTSRALAGDANCWAAWLQTEKDQRIGKQEGCDGVDSGDIDGDGDNDIVVTSIKNGITIWLNEHNTGTFIESGPEFYPGTINVKLFDADLDGNLDLIAANIMENETRWWLNNANGLFISTDQLFGNSWASSIAVGKLDTDDAFDVVVGNENDSDGIEVYFGE